MPTNFTVVPVNDDEDNGNKAAATAGDKPVSLNNIFRDEDKDDNSDGSQSGRNERREKTVWSGNVGLVNTSMCSERSASRFRRGSRGFSRLPKAVTLQCTGVSLNSPSKSLQTQTITCCGKHAGVKCVTIQPLAIFNELTAAVPDLFCVTDP